MTNKYHSRGDRPPSPGHPSCVPADKEKIVNCFYMRLITNLCGYKKKKNEGTHKQLGKHQHSTPVPTMYLNIYEILTEKQMQASLRSVDSCSLS